MKTIELSDVAKGKTKPLQDLLNEIWNNFFKIRLANSNKNKGKSAGYRIYYYLKINDTVYLLTIYDKSEIESINESILDEFIDEIIKE